MGKRLGATLFFPLFEFDGGISLNVLLAVAAQIPHRARGKVHLITHNPRAPTRCEKLWKRAFSGLIDADRRDQSLAVESRHVSSADSKGGPCMTTGPSSVRYKLWHAQRPDVAANSGAPQSFGKVRKSANLRADCGYMI